MGDVSTSAVPRTAPASARAPLGELPLAMFLYPNNTSPACPPSPVSLPLKRGPPALEAGPSESTQKRRSHDRDHETPRSDRRVSALGEDDLGTGKSPARRLFTESSATPPSHPHPAAQRTLAPSPLADSGPKASANASSSSAVATAIASTSISTTIINANSTAIISTTSTATSTVTAPTPRRSTRLAKHESMHDPGFNVLSDDDPRARPHKPTAQQAFSGPTSDQENVPPPMSSAVSATPHKQRRKFERSKLGTHVSAPSVSPPRGKEAMKLEADTVE